MLNFEQQNILFQSKNSLRSNQILFDPNTLSQQNKSQLTSNNSQEIKLNEQQTFYSSDNTSQKCLQGRIAKLSQNKLFSNIVCQIRNQEKQQSVFVSYSINDCSLQDKNFKFQQSYHFNQVLINAQREQTVITKNSLEKLPRQVTNENSTIGIVEYQKQNSKDQQQELQCNEELCYQIVDFFQEMLDLLLKILKELEIIQVQPNQQAKLENLIHQALLLVAQIEKLPLEIHKILQMLISITGQTQKEQIQYPKVLANFHDVVEQFLNNLEQPFLFLTQLIKFLQQFYNIREKHKDNSAQFQLMLQNLQIIKEKNDKTILETKNILQRLRKKVLWPENMQEQSLNITDQLSNILEQHLINLSCQDNKQVAKQLLNEKKYDEEFDFQKFELKVQKKQQKLLSTESKLENLQEFYNYVFIQMLKMLEQNLNNIVSEFNLQIISLDKQKKKGNIPFAKDNFEKESEKIYEQQERNVKNLPKNVKQKSQHMFTNLPQFFEQIAINQEYENKQNSSKQKQELKQNDGYFDKSNLCQIKQENNNLQQLIDQNQNQQNNQFDFDLKISEIYQNIDNKNPQQQEDDKEYISKKSLINQFINFPQKELNELIKQIQEKKSYFYQSINQHDDVDQLSQVIKIEWNQEIFDKINQTSSFKNMYFQSQKTKIFNKLKNENIFINKLINSNEKGDLFDGFEELGESQYNDKIIKILYNQSLEQEKDKILDIFKYESIQINENDTHILILDKEECLSFQKKCKQYMKTILKNLNFKQQENLFQITLENQKQNFLISFLKQQKNYLCEFTDQNAQEIMIDANLQQIIQSFQNYILNSVFNISINKNDNSQVSDDVPQKNDEHNQLEIDKNQNISQHISVQYDQNQVQNLDFLQNNIVEEQKDNFQYLSNSDQQINDKIVSIQSNQSKIQLDQIRHYKFIEFQKYPNISEIDQREWNESKFFIANKGQIINQQFLSQRSQIFKIFKSKSYFLCKCFAAHYSKSIFIGYKQISEIIYQDCVFLFTYSSNSQEIKDYLIIKQFNEEIKICQISYNFHILILSREVYVQYHLLFDKLNHMINWSYQDFNEINSDIFKLKNCNQCKNCKLNKQCSDFNQFRNFQKHQDLILRKLQEKQYFLTKYLNKGGFGMVFEGYKRQLHDFKELVYKIQFNQNVQDELKIMQIFEFHQHVARIVDYIQVDEQINVLVLEKCQYSLSDELEQIKKQKCFPKEKLGKMFVDLIEGLVLFRIYNILHLDIKPSNILISKEGNYVYTDFGISFLKNTNKYVQVKGMTEIYASPEQKSNGQNINFDSDIYSLGKTFKIIIDVYNQVQPNPKIQKAFEEIIQNCMLQNDPKNRKQCLEMHLIILEKTLDMECFSIQPSFLSIKKLIDYNKNKDTTLFQQIKIQYYKNYLVIFSGKYSQKILKQIQPYLFNQIQAQLLNEISICNINLGDNNKALEYLLESLQMAKQIFKENHPHIATYLHNVGSCYQNLGDNKKALEYLLESLQMLKQIFKEIHPNIAQSMNNIGSCYQDLGDNKKALEYFLESLQITKQIFKENHPDIAKSLNNVGSCYQNLGDNKKALEYLLESLQITKQIFKENHPDIIQSLNDVGLFYQNLGDYKKALEYLLESLQMTKQIFKENHPHIATFLNNVGSCYQNLGDNKKALEYLLESLQMTKQIFKESHPDVATSLNSVGLYYLNLRDNNKAFEYLLESLQMRKQIFKENHPDVATSLNNIGLYYQNLGQNKKALEYLLKSLQMRKQIFKENHPNIAQSMNNIGSCYQDLGDNKKALEYLLESLQMTKQIFKESHPDIATSLNNVGSCYQNLGDNKKALEYLLESLQMIKQIFKENHPNIAKSLDNVGSCYQNLRDNKKALEHLLQSLEMRKQIFKKNHPDIATSLNNVGLCYQNLGDNKKALEYLLESLEMRKQIFKKNHPDIATSLNNIGCCYQNLGDNKKVLDYLLESLQMRKQIFKENHPDVVTSLNNIGLYYKNLGQNKNALEYLLESLQMKKQIFKEKHPDIAKSLNNVGSCYQNLGDNKKALEYSLESLQMIKQIFKEKHPDIAKSLDNVGNCYQNLRDNKKALEHLLESLLK